MRLMIGFGLAALLAIAPAASAQSPVAVGPLAVGEVLLEINALGQVTNPADRAEFSGTVTGRGADDAAAQADYQAALSRIQAAARAAGVDAADIQVGPVRSSDDYFSAAMMGNVLDNATSFDVEEAGELPQTQRMTTATIRIRTDPARVDQLLQALAAAGFESGGEPAFRLADETAARRAARERAIAAARADADAYAASLGMRVARVLRVTERTGFDFMDLMLNEGMGPGRAPPPFGQMSETERGQVQTFVYIGVDFALAPR